MVKNNKRSDLPRNQSFHVKHMATFSSLFSSTQLVVLTSTGAAAAGVLPSGAETCSWKWQAGTNTSCSWTGMVLSPLWSFCTTKFKSKSILKRKQQASVLALFCKTHIYYYLSQCMRNVYARILTHWLRNLAAAIQQLRAQVWWWHCR